jgi:hypothetical protein
MKLWKVAAAGRDGIPAEGRDRQAACLASADYRSRSEDYRLSGRAGRSALEARTGWMGERSGRHVSAPIRGPRPIGFELAWHGLYQEPFEGHEEASLRFQLERLEHEYDRPIGKDRTRIMSELTDFLRALARAVGESSVVYAVVDDLEQRSAASQAAALPEPVT